MIQAQGNLKYAYVKFMQEPFSTSSGTVFVTVFAMERGEMNVLVTGGAGYIGTVVASQLLYSVGHNVRVLDNLTYGGRQLFSFCDYVDFMYGDVRSRADCGRAVQDTDCVIHLAAIVGERACKQNPIDTWEINNMGTQNMYIAAKNAGVQKFVFSSTCSNYGRTEAATEETELMPLGEYSRQKVDVESWLKLQGDVTILRFATAYGFSPRMRLDLMIQEFIIDALRDGKLEIYNPTAWRPFVHVRDIARAIERVIWYPNYSEVYNVGGTNITKIELANEIAKHIPLEITTRETGDDRDYKVVFEKIQKTFSFTPKHTPQEFIREVIDLWKKGVFSETVYTNSPH